MRRYLPIARIGMTARLPDRYDYCEILLTSILGPGNRLSAMRILAPKFNKELALNIGDKRFVVAMEAGNSGQDGTRKYTIAIRQEVSGELFSLLIWTYKNGVIEKTDFLPYSAWHVPYLFDDIDAMSWRQMQARGICCKDIDGPTAEELDIIEAWVNRALGNEHSNA